MNAYVEKQSHDNDGAWAATSRLFQTRDQTAVFDFFSANYIVF